MRATNHAHARESATGARRSRSQAFKVRAVPSLPASRVGTLGTRRPSSKPRPTSPHAPPSSPPEHNTHRAQDNPFLSHAAVPEPRRDSRYDQVAIPRPPDKCPARARALRLSFERSSSCARAHAVGARGNRGRRVRLHLVGRGVGGEDRVTSDASGVAQRRECDTPPGCANSAGGRAHRLRGGVSGRLAPPKLNFCLSAGLRMRKEHMSDSSTDMTAPALSNSPQ